MKYYVLGMKNNQMLQEYLDKYYLKLKENLKELRNQYKEDNIEFSKSIDKLLEWGSKNRKFIMNGDNSSVINFLYIEGKNKTSQGLIKNQLYQDKLLEEMTLFLNGEDEKLIQNRGRKIGGTNIRLSIEDNSPYGKIEAHPDHYKNGGIHGWGEKSEEDWLDIYEKTFTLLRETDSGVYDELNNIVSKIIPLGTAVGMHNSASYKECIGHLHMGFTIDSDQPELNNLEAIIHESSHNKLNLIKQFDPLILSNFEEKYYSPYRNDARHISGIYLGIHAFVPVIYILMKALSEGKIGEGGYWLEKIVIYYLKNKFCLRVLKKHGKFTYLGQEILDEVQEVMIMTDLIFKSLNLDKQIILKAKKHMIHHFQDVNNNYPHLEY